MASSSAVAVSHSSFPDFSPHHTKQAVLDHLAETPLLARVTAASHLEIRPAPETVSFGIAALDALTGGLPRGSLTEISGPDSSGRTSVLLAAIAAATQRGEICVLIDATDSFHPHSAAAAGVDLTRLLWVRCNAGTSNVLPKSSQSESSQTKPVLHENSATSRTARHSAKRAAPPSNSARSREPRPARQLRESRDGYVSEQTHLTTDAQGVRNFFQPSSGPRTRSAHATAAPEQANLFSQETARAKWKRRKMEDPVEQALRATDLILQSGGFGMVAIDLAGVPVKTARRVPLTTWFRFRRVIENTPTVLLLIDEQPCAQTCTSLGLKMTGQDGSAKKHSKSEGKSSVIGHRPSAESSPLSVVSSQLSAIRVQQSALNSDTPASITSTSLSFRGPSFGARNLLFFEGEHETVPLPEPTPLAAQSSEPEALTHAHLLEGLHLQAEVLRRTDRKPMQSVTSFPTKAVWTG